ncbi:MAG: hypothetical protein KF809_14745 [Chloroflexi bacterium]|nr:hypothetical protein [Chloroflexota bacterium]
MPATRASVGQLHLPLDVDESGSSAAWRRWSVPMVPGDGPAPFDDPAWFFEPWWPGSSTTLVIGPQGIRLLTSHLADPTAAFPELAGIPGQVDAHSAVVTGTLLVLDDEGLPDAEALRARLVDPRPPGGLRAADDPIPISDRRQRVGRGAFIASDLLEQDGEPLTLLPFSERRARLIDLVRDDDRFLVGRGLHGEGETLAEAAASIGIEGIAARRLDTPWRPGPAPDAWLRLPVRGTPVVPSRPLLVLLQRLPLDRGGTDR